MYGFAQRHRNGGHAITQSTAEKVNKKKQGNKLLVRTTNSKPNVFHMSKYSRINHTYAPHIYLVMHL